MNNLPRIIGPAPSELTFEQFCERLSHERDRVRKAIELFRSSVGLSSQTKKPSKTSLNKQLAALMKDLNLTEEEVLKIVEDL
uniref:Uncharacterized protein n=1 Tax=viral metagenome TaxID=1070528 RepID=A0A6M3L0P2_9ZZZZ